MSGILWVPDIFWDGRGVYLDLLIKHFFFFFFLLAKHFYCGIFWTDLEIMCHYCQISKMLLLQMLFSFKIFCHCLTGTFFSSYFHACISFLEVVKFLSFLLLASYVFFPIVSPIYFLSPCSTLIFKQAFTLEHVTRAAFHCLSSKVYSPSDLFEKSPFLSFSLLSSGPLSFWSIMCL